ncbi:class I SAM-dependent methyltransferase [Coralliovum pocilloporae]|uniref:class I SAM-dependent methyltransferase n=1 Tax=Coralliovum pocilloporae TaxID=3066369 RepID=UPI003307A609
MIVKTAFDVSSFYDELSDDYHKVETDWVKWLEFNQVILRDLFDRYCPSAVKVLDCAAGIGSQAIALQRLGFDVTASDASSKSLAQLAQYASIPSVCCLWHELGKYFVGNEFDAVVCIENAISHLPDRESLALSLASMRDQLSRKQESCLFVSTRDFDEILRIKPNGYPLNADRTSRYFQEWTWVSDDSYLATWYICGERKSTAKMRCIREQELVEIANELGMNIEHCNSAYYQPIFCLRWG